MSVSRSCNWFSFANLKGMRNYFSCCRITAVQVFKFQLKLHCSGWNTTYSNYCGEDGISKQKFYIFLFCFQFSAGVVPVVIIEPPENTWDNWANKSGMKVGGAARAAAHGCCWPAGICPASPSPAARPPPSPASAPEEYRRAAERHSINGHRENSHRGLLAWGKTAAERLVFLQLR